MTKHTSTDGIGTDLQYLPINKLYLHDMNPRQSTSDEDVSAIAESITINGLLQNLLGYADPKRSGKIGIVAGGRRLRGLMHLKATGAQSFDSKAPDFAAIPVRVTDDAFLARAWAGTESATQKPLHPADEIRAYAAMAEQGNSAEMIARAFAQTVRHVKGRLALAHLQPPTMDALREGKISLDVAKLLTIARDADQELEVLSGALDDPGAWWVKQRLTDNKVRANNYKAVYVGTDAYVAAGGRMREDLFDDAAYLDDPDILDQLFQQKLTDIAEGIKAQFGWKWVEICTVSYVPYSAHSGYDHIQGEKVTLSKKDQNEQAQLEAKACSEGLTDAELERLEELEAKTKRSWDEKTRADCGIFVHVDTSGRLKIDGAYRDAKRSRVKGSADTAGGAASAPSPKLTQAGVEDLRRIRLLALQTATLGKTELVLDLFAWQLELGYACHSGLFNVTLTDPQIEPEVEGAWTVDEALTDGSNQSQLGGTRSDYASSFKDFQAKGKKHSNTVLTRHLIRAINGPTMNSIGMSLLAPMVKPDIRSIWTPDAPTYFSRVDKGSLEQIWKDLVSDQSAEEDPLAFDKLKKGEKVNHLHRLFNDSDFQSALNLSQASLDKIASWLPPELSSESSA